MNLLRSPEDAHDVYQEAFLRVFRNLEQLPLRLQFPHLAVPHRDQSVPGPDAQAQGAPEEEPAVLAAPTEGRWTAWIRSRRSGWMGIRNGTCSAASYADRIKTVLEGLTPRERMVFELRHYQASPAAHRRDFGNHRGSGQELPVPGDAEDAGRFGRFCMNRTI